MKKFLSFMFICCFAVLGVGLLSGCGKSEFQFKLTVAQGITYQVTDPEGKNLSVDEKGEMTVSSDSEIIIKLYAENSVSLDNLKITINGADKTSNLVRNGDYGGDELCFGRIAIAMKQISDDVTVEITL